MSVKAAEVLDEQNDLLGAIQQTQEKAESATKRNPADRTVPQ